MLWGYKGAVMKFVSFGSAVIAALFIVAVGFAHEGHHSDGTTQPTSQPTTQQAAIDLQNTVCPVTGDSVGDSKLTETYQGKIYHLCCDDCPKDFQKDPQKYANKVAADPAKYGVKKGS
jgi:YHS domain-containing protein